MAPEVLMGNEYDFSADGNFFIYFIYNIKDK